MSARVRFQVVCFQRGCFQGVCFRDVFSGCVLSDGPFRESGVCFQTVHIQKKVRIQKASIQTVHLGERTRRLARHGILEEKDCGD